MKEDTRFSEYVVDNQLEYRNYDYDETKFRLAFTIENHRVGTVDNLDRYFWFEAKLITKSGLED